jgi:hypothetical protein
MDTTITPAKCEHQHIVTTAAVDAVRRDGKIVGHRLYLEAKCNECGEPFRFPYYLPNEGEQIMAAASVSKRGTKLITPIIPGRIATDLN